LKIEWIFDPTQISSWSKRPMKSKHYFKSKKNANQTLNEAIQAFSKKLSLVNFALSTKKKL